MLEASFASIFIRKDLVPSYSLQLEQNLMTIILFVHAKLTQSLTYRFRFFPLPPLLFERSILRYIILFYFLCRKRKKKTKLREEGRKGNMEGRESNSLTFDSIWGKSYHRMGGTCIKVFQTLSKHVNFCSTRVNQYEIEKIVNLKTIICDK